MQSVKLPGELCPQTAPPSAPHVLPMKPHDSNTGLEDVIMKMAPPPWIVAALNVNVQLLKVGDE
jgi:hypothetical protein